MKRFRIVVLMSVLFLAILSCQTISETESNTKTQIAGEYSATLTALAEKFKLPGTPSLTRFPSQEAENCNWIREKYGFCTNATVTPEPDGVNKITSTPTPTQTLNPYEKGQITISSDKKWVWFYDDGGEKAGQVINGSTWDTIGGKIILEGWVPDYDLYNELETALCNNHTWDHDKEKLHCHIFEDHGHVLAVFFENVKYQRTGYESMKSIPDPSGEVYPQNGRVITLVGAFTVP